MLAACCRGGWCCGCSCRGGRCPGASPSHCASAWPAAGCGSSPSLGGSGSRSSVRCQTLLPGDIGFLIRIGKRSMFKYITGKNSQFLGGSWEVYPLPVVEVPPQAVSPVCEWSCLGWGRSGSEQRAAPPELSTSTLAVSPHLLLPPLTIITAEDTLCLLSVV